MNFPPAVIAGPEATLRTDQVCSLLCIPFNDIAVIIPMCAGVDTEVLAGEAPLLPAGTLGAIVGKVNWSFVWCRSVCGTMCIGLNQIDDALDVIQVQTKLWYKHLIFCWLFAKYGMMRP